MKGKISDMRMITKTVVITFSMATGRAVPQTVVLLTYAADSTFTTTILRFYGRCRSHQGRQLNAIISEQWMTVESFWKFRYLSSFNVIMSGQQHIRNFPTAALMTFECCMPCCGHCRAEHRASRAQGAAAAEAQGPTLAVRANATSCCAKMASHKITKNESYISNDSSIIF